MQQIIPWRRGNERAKQERIDLSAFLYRSSCTISLSKEWRRSGIQSRVPLRPWPTSEKRSAPASASSRAASACPPSAA